MAHIGHTAARLNIFLDIPVLLRAISQSVCGREGPKMQIGMTLWDEIWRYDPLDPTQVYKEYFCDWWNYKRNMELHPVEFDLKEAFGWHIQKVSSFFHSVPMFKLFPIGSTVVKLVTNI
jgi:hypothetical protein